MKLFLLSILRFYQKTISPDHSMWGRSRYPFGVCKYIPTCSEYAYQAIQENGVVKGVWKAFWHIVRCNPFSRGNPP